MKRHSIIRSAIAGGLGLLLAVATANAQDTQTRQRNVRTQQRDRSQTGSLDDKTTGANIRASQLIGMNIQNSQDESVGEVNDIVLDANAGRVQYLAVTYGGFLGVGSKMFAVPFAAFKCQRDPGNPDDHVLVLDVTQRQLEGAEGFDEDHWPNFADSKFTDDLHKRYNIKRRIRDRDVDVDVSRDGVNIDVENKKPEQN